MALTPVPISVGQDWTNIRFPEKISAINNGAHIKIQIAHSELGNLDIVKRLQQASRTYPDGCVTGRLVTNNGDETVVRNRGTSASNSDTYLILSAGHDMPLYEPFTQLRIQTTCQLNSVKIEWQNFSE